MAQGMEWDRSKYTELHNKWRETPEGSDPLTGEEEQFAAAYQRMVERGVFKDKDTMGQRIGKVVKEILTTSDGQTWLRGGSGEKLNKLKEKEGGEKGRLYDKMHEEGTEEHIKFLEGQVERTELEFKEAQERLRKFQRES